MSDADYDALVHAILTVVGALLIISTAGLGGRQQVRWRARRAGSVAKPALSRSEYLTNTIALLLTGVGFSLVLKSVLVLGPFVLLAAIRGIVLMSRRRPGEWVSRQSDCRKRLGVAPGGGGAMTG